MCFGVGFVFSHKIKMATTNNKFIMCCVSVCTWQAAAIVQCDHYQINFHAHTKYSKSTHGNYGSNSKVSYIYPQHLVPDFQNR